MKKVLAVALAVVMVIAIIPAVTINADAAGSAACIKPIKGLDVPSGGPGITDDGNGGYPYTISSKDQSYRDVYAWFGIDFPSQAPGFNISDYESLSFEFTPVSGDILNNKRVFLLAGTSSSITGGKELGGANDAAAELLVGSLLKDDPAWAVATPTAFIGVNGPASVPMTFTFDAAKVAALAGETVVRFAIYAPAGTNSVWQVRDVELKAKGCNNDCATCGGGSGSRDYDIKIELKSGENNRWTAPVGYSDLTPAVYRITNTGNKPLTGVNLYFYFKSGAFEILTPSLPTTLGAGVFFDISVRPKNGLPPSATEYWDIIEVAANELSEWDVAYAYLELWVVGASSPAGGGGLGGGGDSFFTDHDTRLKPDWSSFDVPSEWAKDAYDKAITLDLVPHKLKFNLRWNLNRADFSALAVKLYEYLSGKTIDVLGTFNDTDDINVQKLAGLGIVQGDGKGVFDPNGYFTREMALTLMYNMMVKLGYKFDDADPSFADAENISKWARKAIGALQKAKIVEGDGANFNPSQVFTREMGITTVINFLDYIK